MTVTVRKAIVVLVPSILLVLSAVPSTAGAGASRDTVLDLRSFYGALNGAFVALDTRTGVTFRYQPALCAKRLSPASTFKVLNSLIGLETGVIPDEHFVIRWDSIQRPVQSWNRDHDLASAIANSVVWYYQELARRVGIRRMKRWVNAIPYGNRDISGGIDRFWLGSSLLISADEQVAFLNRVRTGDLPFSQRSMEIVRRILVQDSTPRWVLRGKTGFADFGKSNGVGWYVGWVERPDGAVVFANCMTTDDVRRDGDAIFARRKEIAIAILKSLGVID